MSTTTEMPGPALPGAAPADRPRGNGIAAQAIAVSAVAAVCSSIAEAMVVEISLMRPMMSKMLSIAFTEDFAAS